MEFALHMERYSDDAVVAATSEETLVAVLSEQDAAAPRFRVCHVPSKEEYLYITWNGHAGATMAIQHAEYGRTQGALPREADV